MMTITIAKEIQSIQIWTLWHCKNRNHIAWENLLGKVGKISAIFTGGDSTAVFSSIAGLPVNIALSGTSLLFLLQQQLHENSLNYLP